MKKLIILSLVLLLVLSVAIPGMAKTVVTLWTRPTQRVEGLESGVYEQRVIDEFEALYPDVEVLLEIIPWGGSGDQKVKFNIAAGTPPDLRLTGEATTRGLQNAGLLLDFEDMLTIEEKAKFHDGVVDICSVDGKMYFYPTSISPNCIMVNLTLVKEAGADHLLPLDRPSRSWTVEEFRAFLIKVAEAKLPGVLAWGFNFADAYGHHQYRLMMIQAFGQDMFAYEDGKVVCTVNSPEAIEGIEFYMDIYNNYPGVFPSGSENVDVMRMDDLWCAGKLASWTGNLLPIVDGHRIAGGTENVTVVLVPYPAIEGIKNMSSVDYMGWQIFDTGNPERAKYAKLLVDYWEENAPDWIGARGNGLPIREDQEYSQKFQRIAGKNVEYDWAAKYLPLYKKDTCGWSPVYAQFAEIFRVTMQGVFVGELTAAEAVKIVEDKTNKALDEYYAE